jgi:hypothetical protein
MLSVLIGGVITLVLTIVITNIVHEVGHLIVLKYFYKIEDAGMGFGNVKNREIFNIKLGKVKIYFFRILPHLFSGSVAFVYPWKEVHEGSIAKRVLFYSAGYLAELALSLILFIILLTNKDDFTIVTNLYLSIAILLSGLSPLMNLVFGVWVKKVKIDETAQILLKVDYGYSDGKGVLINSRLIFTLSLLISVGYTAILYKNLIQIYY